ncbi:MAG: ribose-phosphate pyrophosphokinase [Streptobacillus sp.]
MAKYTEHLRLVKPEGNEYYNVEQFNQNAELIDKETKKLSEGLAKVQEGATREKAGIVQFGTEEGKALEGMMLARLAGCVGYGGDIQEPGVKDVNYIYYDRNTRKMYKCLNQNSDVSANVANFVPLDNNSLLDRLENLYKVTKTDLNISNVTFAYVIKQGNICFLFIDSKQAFYGKKKDDTLFTLPQNVIPSEDIAFSFNSISSNSSAAAKIYKNGQCRLLSSQVLNDAFYISVSYVCDNFN